jgi:hypothetical protein
MTNHLRVVRSMSDELAAASAPSHLVARVRALEAQVLHLSAVERAARAVVEARRAMLDADADGMGEAIDRETEADDALYALFGGL